MADDVDRATELQETQLKIALGKQSKKKRLNAVGRCFNCNEVVGQDALFCDSDCREDYEKRQQMKGVRA